MPSKLKDKKTLSKVNPEKPRARVSAHSSKVHKRAVNTDESHDEKEEVDDNQTSVSRTEAGDDGEENWIDEYEPDEDDESDEGVDEEGMAKLMNALGEDGLDEFAQEQLRALADDDDEWSDDEEVEEEEVDGSGEEEDEAEEAEEAEDSVNNEQADTASHAGPSAEVAVPVDELSDEDMLDDDAMPRQKVEIDNKLALERIRCTIALVSSLPWTETLTVSYPEIIGVDVDDDLNRELAFYKQALHGVQTARSLAQKHNFPFTRPADYFAEMVKSDSHMERIRQRLLDESAGLKRSEEKRKEREGKKFGKQVQLEKIKERQQNKKDIEERLKGLKRKRKDALDGAGGDEDFDVAVEDAIADRPSKRAKGPNGKSKLPRTARDKKFGFGGAGKRSKQNTKDSTDSFVQRGGPRSKKTGQGKGGKGGKVAPKRPGKSKRMAQRSRT